MRLLEEESSLLEIARLVGTESLSYEDRLKLETARSIREDFLHQNAFHEVDTYTSLSKQYHMLKAILDLHQKCLVKLKEGKEFEELAKLASRAKIAKMKYIPEDQNAQFEAIEKEIESIQ
jgi:V/A-type H+-transporting ATPase subunit A